MRILLRKAKERGYAKHGWLETYHSFSFASYFDPARMGFGALRVINDDRIAPGQGFGAHGHANMEIITIPLSGSLAHQDSMGNRETIETGEIQVMSAGTGVEHSEFNASETEEVTLLQIWILPNQENVTPRYYQKKIDLLEVSNKLSLVVGNIGNAPLGIHQEAKLSLGRFDENTECVYALDSEKHGAYIFVIEGGVRVGEIELGQRDALGIWETQDLSMSVEPGSYILVIEIPMRDFFG